MPIFVSDPVIQTYLFLALILFALALTVRNKDDHGLFTKETTLELKGFAILAILFSHIGYFLVADHRFLYPVSTLAGVGVNLFLFLSGLGLTASALSHPRTILDFYRRRLSKIYVPLWITLVLFFALDFFLLSRVYDLQYALYAFLGWFRAADLAHDINSPLWYISLTLFYYILFPLVFSRRYPYLSAAILYAIAYTIVWSEPDALRTMMPLYEIHIAAFPLGMLAGWLVQMRHNMEVTLPNAWRYAALIPLGGAIAYFAINSGVGAEPWIEQTTSLVTVAFILAFFIIKRFEFKLLSLFGLVSFEIYLVHWPILSRYDILFKYLPPALAMPAYLALFVALAWLLRRVEEQLAPYVRRVIARG